MDNRTHILEHHSVQRLLQQYSSVTSELHISMNLVYFSILESVQPTKDQTRTSNQHVQCFSKCEDVSNIRHFTTCFFNLFLYLSPLIYGNNACSSAEKSVNFCHMTVGCSGVTQRSFSRVWLLQKGFFGKC